MYLFPSGWGSADFGDSVSGSLQKSHLKVTSMSQCTDKYKANTYQDHLCTIYLPKVNSCQVDSGGPLLWSDPATGRLNVIGVVSSKFVCTESTTSVQTRLATVNNLNWIKVILTGKITSFIDVQRSKYNMIIEREKILFSRTLLLQLTIAMCT